MVACSCNITLGAINFDFLTECKISHSWRTLTDTAELVLPRAVIHRYDLQHKRFDDIVRRGDSATIAFGYDDRLVTRFKGYVTSNKPGMPMTIKMEDGMYTLKEANINPKTFKAGVGVQDILAYIGITSYELIGDIKILGDFAITPKEDTATRVLMKLKDAIHLAVFFKRGVLHIGDVYQIASPRVVDLQIGYNVIDYSGLEFKHADDVRIKVIAISNKKNGKKLKVTMGDKTGEVHTLNFGDLPSADALVAEAKKYIGKLKYTGFRGKIKLFGEPIVEFGDIANFIDPEGEITGRYWIDAVEETSGMGGICQEATIGVIADGGQSVGQQDYVNNIKVLSVETTSGGSSSSVSPTSVTQTPLSTIIDLPYPFGNKFDSPAPAPAPEPARDNSSDYKYQTF